jgi:hypothetical protein
LGALTEGRINCHESHAQPSQSLISVSWLSRDPRESPIPEGK